MIIHLTFNLTIDLTIFLTSVQNYTSIVGFISILMYCISFPSRGSLLVHIVVRSIHPASPRSHSDKNL